MAHINPQTVLNIILGKHPTGGVVISWAITSFNWYQELRRTSSEQNRMYERKAFFSYIVEASDYTYIHLILFCIIEVKKFFAYIYGARDCGKL